MNANNKMVVSTDQGVRSSNSTSESSQGISPLDADYFQKYDYAKAKIINDAELKEKGLALPHEPPVLDIRVRMIFDEDLSTLIFPKVKEMSFRVSSDTPFEVAAKALAFKNGHKDLWKSYSFSILKKDPKAKTQQQQQQQLPDEDMSNT